METIHLGVIGYGSIAKSLMDLLAGSRVTDVTVLVRPTTSTPEPDEATDGPTVTFKTSLPAFLGRNPDLVVECAGHAAVNDHLPGILGAGHDTIVASVGAFADQQVHTQAKIAASLGKSRIIIPIGAIGGLDILGSISLRGDVQLSYRGVKPARAWVGTPADDVIDLNNLTDPVTVFTGTGREAALAFPKNANVVAALALAGGGFDRMRVELVADPHAKTNKHAYSVVSDHCSYSMSIAAAPSDTNARTSLTTALSILKEITAY